MKRYATIPLIISLIYLLSACASMSVDTKLYGTRKIQTVPAWAIEFAYETGTTEQLQKSTGDAEMKVVRSGQLPEDLLLRDDLFFLLKDEYGIPMTKKPPETAGRIQIHTIRFPYGWVRLLTVTLVDQQGETLARFKIRNGDVGGFFPMRDEEFIKKSAKAIAEAIKAK